MQKFWFNRNGKRGVRRTQKSMQFLKSYLQILMQSSFMNYQAGDWTVILSLETPLFSSPGNPPQGKRWAMGNFVDESSSRHRTDFNSLFLLAFLCWFLPLCINFPPFCLPDFILAIFEDSEGIFGLCEIIEIQWNLCRKCIMGTTTRLIFKNQNVFLWSLFIPLVKLSHKSLVCSCPLFEPGGDRVS